MCCAIYVIILIQILIRYNVKNLITACTRSLDFDLKIGKNLPTLGDPPPRPAPPARSLRSLAIVTFPLGAPPPPQCVDPRYATAHTYIPIACIMAGTNESVRAGVQ